MARRRWRYDQYGNATEIVDRRNEYHFVRGEIAAFRSPIDGTLIDSRTKYEDHCARHHVVPFTDVQGATREYDRYTEEKLDRANRRYTDHQARTINLRGRR